MIKALQSQRKLKPYYYRRASRVGRISTIVGGLFSFQSWIAIGHLFGIDPDASLEPYSGAFVLAFFLCCIAAMLVCLIASNIALAWIYYSAIQKSSGITQQEINDIAFRGIYPNQWQREDEE